MKKIILSKNHITFTSARDIFEICKPLNKFGITSFNYIRNYYNGSQVNLSNTPLWLEHFYEQEYYNIGAFENHPKNYENGALLWPSLSGQKVFYDARTYYDIDNGITVVEKHQNCCDFFYFGSTSKNTQATNFYINNSDLLKKFILYFRESGKKILKAAEKSRIIRPDLLWDKKNNKRDTNLNQLREEFLNDIKLEEKVLTESFQGKRISSKQACCLHYISKGKTAKEIAKLMGISNRTVEAHIAMLKSKF